ncbi:Lysophospholipase, alpha-beta hydrolase superfamily [Ensifer adhaerens]|nr:Lysophospholipase, alpha-beta hydrolase superfamily [Ensifer adhaerens]
MFETTQYLKSATGATLAYHVAEASSVPRGIVLIAHGMSEHSKRYARFAGHLAAKGYHAYAWDHRGHGETTAPDAVQGQFARRDGLDTVIADTIAMRDMAAAKHPGLPVLLFGHSMGAMICLNTALKHADSFAGFAVWNFDFGTASSMPLMRMILGVERWLKGSDVPSAILPRMTFDAWGKAIPGHRTLLDWLSNIPEEVDAYIADPLCGFPCTVSLWFDMAEGVLRGSDKGKLTRIPKDKPIMLVGGGKDPATRGAKGVHWMETHMKGLGFVQISKLVYPEARHETLNDIVADKAMADFLGWADGICPSR